jgi:hypothetical protein
MINAESLKSDNVMESGIVRPEAAAKGWGDVNVGLEYRYVFKGLAYSCELLVVVLGALHE